MVHLVATLSVQSSTMSYWRMMARAEALSSRSGCGTASTPELRVARVVARLAALLTPSLASECATWRCRLLYCTVLYCTVLYQYTTPSQGYRLPIIMLAGSKMVLDSNNWETSNISRNFEDTEAPS